GLALAWHELELGLAGVDLVVELVELSEQMRRSSQAHSLEVHYSELPSVVSGRLRIPSREDHFDHESCMASSSSRMNRVDMFTRETTTPGTSPSSTSWSMRANVIVNS